MTWQNIINIDSNIGLLPFSKPKMKNLHVFANIISKMAAFLNHFVMASVSQIFSCLLKFDVQTSPANFSFYIPKLISFFYIFMCTIYISHTWSSHSFLSYMQVLLFCKVIMPQFLPSASLNFKEIIVVSTVWSCLSVTQHDCSTCHKTVKCCYNAVQYCKGGFRGGRTGRPP